MLALVSEKKPLLMFVNAVKHIILSSLTSPLTRKKKKMMISITAASLSTLTRRKKRRKYGKLIRNK